MKSKSYHLWEGDNLEDKKISTGAKIGYFFLALVPFISYWIIQLGVTIAFMLPRISEVMNALQNGNTEKYTEIVSEISPPATFVMHVAMALIFGLWYFFGRTKNPERQFRFRPKILLVTFVMALSLSVLLYRSVFSLMLLLIMNVWLKCREWEKVSLCFYQHRFLPR